MEKQINWKVQAMIFDKFGQAIPIKRIQDKPMDIVIPDVPPEVEITIDAPDSVESGSDFRIRINIANVVGYDSSQVDIIYDPTLVEIDGTEGNALAILPGMIGDKEIPLDAWGDIPPGESGRVRFLSNAQGVAGVSGDGYLFEVNFYAK